MTVFNVRTKIFLQKLKCRVNKTLTKKCKRPLAKCFLENHVTLSKYGDLENFAVHPLWNWLCSIVHLDLWPQCTKFISQSYRWKFVIEFPVDNIRGMKNFQSKEFEIKLIQCASSSKARTQVGFLLRSSSGLFHWTRSHCKSFFILFRIIDFFLHKLFLLSQKLGLNYLLMLCVRFKFS